MPRNRCIQGSPSTHLHAHDGPLQIAKKNNARPTWVNDRAWTKIFAKIAVVQIQTHTDTHRAVCRIRVPSLIKNSIHIYLLNSHSSSCSRPPHHILPSLFCFKIWRRTPRRQNRYCKLCRQTDFFAVRLFFFFPLLQYFSAFSSTASMTWFARDRLGSLFFTKIFSTFGELLLPNSSECE